MQSHVIRQGQEVASTILVGRDLTASLVEVVTNKPRRRAAILSQPATTDLANRFGTVLEAAGLDVARYGLPDGEAAKQLSVVEDVYRFLNRKQFSRSDLVIGVGGGALTDVAGFISATYLRGLSTVYLPTTLLGDRKSVV
jgi:3-dehydroquinate synthase